MKTRKLAGYLHNERGSGTLIIMVGMVIAAIFFGFLFFDFSNVFINKRVTQTGADAAAIAAAQTSNDYMKGYLREKTQEELDHLGEEWEKFLAETLAAYADDGDPETPAPEPPPIEVILGWFVNMKEAALGKSMPGDVRAWLLNRSITVKAATAMKFFFEDDDVSKMSCKAVNDNWTTVKYAAYGNKSVVKSAEEYAKKNQNDKLTDIKLIGDGFRIYVETERKGKYTTVPNSEVPAITSESSAKIGEPDGYRGKISCS